METKTNSAEDFIKRKNVYFKKNNIIKVKDIGRKGVRFFFREAWTFMPQSNLNEKVLVIERLKNEGIAITQTKYEHIVFDEDEVGKILNNKK